MFKPISGGQKIVVGEGFQCWLPPIPDKSQIINYGLPKEEQYWRRLPLPNFYEEKRAIELAKQLDDPMYVDPVLEKYRRREWHRRIYGVWFYNNGEPTYINGYHYYYLNWSKFDHKENDGYPFYYEFSRDNFYIAQWCDENPRSLGFMFIGPRACGKTNELISMVVNRTTRFHNHRTALQSKHYEDDAKKVLIQAKTVPLFNALPDFFKPEFSHGSSPQDMLTFNRPAIKGKLAKGVKFGPDVELNSVIFAAGPGEKALDTETLSDIFEDEIGKQDPKKQGDIYVRHEVNVKCVYRNHRKIGLLRKTSTVEEMDSGGDECLKLWKDSDPHILDGNGYTISKIHRHLISALDTDTSLEEYITSDGKNLGAPCDKYGRVDSDLANIKIQADFDAVKHDLKKLSSRMRKSPRNETEAFIKDQSQSIFNIMLCSTRLHQIRNEMKRKPYRTGNLYWVDKKFGKVWWADDDHAGRFNCAWMPDEFSQIKEPSKAKILNNCRWETGYTIQGKVMEMVHPKNYHLFRIATDPIKYTRTKDPRASKAAIHAFRLYDHLVDGGKPEKDWITHNYFFEYCVRPEDPETYCEDLAMLAIFLGTKVLPERNVTTVNDYFERNGLEHLLYYPNKVTFEGPRLQNKSDDAGLAATPEVIDYYTKRIIPQINKHIAYMPFDNTIEDWMNFDSTNPTKSHLTVSSGFCLVHAEVLAENEEEPDESIEDYFDVYDNAGITGKLARDFVELPKN